MPPSEREADPSDVAATPATVPYFESLERQAHAAHLGMWVFLASEALLFAGLFALYAAYRVEHPAAFAAGVEGNARVLGSLNTLVLLTSSFTVALAVQQSRSGHAGRCAALLATTLLAGGAFLVIKATEYRLHFHEGVFPGGFGSDVAPRQGLVVFHTLYFVMTGLHAIHVVVGMAVLLVTAIRVVGGRVRPPADHPVALAALYWHLVDVIWIFLWPLFYLTGRG